MGATYGARIAATKLGVLVCLLALPLLFARAQDSSQQTGDPVADAARKSREEKKTAAKPKKVFTEDDIAPRPAPKDVQGPATTTPPPDTQQSAIQSGDDAKPAAKGQGQPKESPEVTWRKRFKEAHDRLATAEKQLNILQRDLNKTDLQYYTDPQKAMKEQYTREGIKERTEKIDIQKAEIAKLKQALVDMEDELRKSGGEIGWARE
ncbi:MAG TPA: hypothetical protein VN982_17375 [Candidatus Dormibacteraeota bacterium]|nr:hypothetical protein [Candidatus Dormibacteraeota bacterium]